MKNKKTILAIIGIIAIILVTIGITYAYWLVTKTQTGSNVITAGCLDITLNGESNDINLTNQFPLSDEEGMELVPYEFTVTNNCNTAVDYQVNLESIGTESTALKDYALKLAINEFSALLSNKIEVAPTVSGAYASHRLTSGTLEAASADNTNDSVTYELRIWIDADAPISGINKTYTGKISVTVGQGVNNILKEGTLAHNIVSQYGDVDSIQALTTHYRETSPENYNQKKPKASDSYYWGTDYILNRETGYYTLSGNIVQATVSECRQNKNLCGNYTLYDTTSPTKEAASIYVISSFTHATKADTATYNYTTHQRMRSVNDFEEGTTFGEYGLYAAKDDLGTSYYFRGDVENNYVQFGYDLNEEPINWRIIRINGDGTIRMIHDSNISTASYNSGNEEKYIGYTYDDGTGKQIDSYIKGIVDSWYTKNLATNYEEFIADSIFCNDRNPQKITESLKTYGGYERLLGNSPAPSLICSRKEDKYTVNSSLGNGYLINPIGLITADEIIMAGAAPRAYNTHFQSTYLYTGEYFWTSTPSHSSLTGTSGVYNWYIGPVTLDKDTYTVLDNESSIAMKAGIRPVINLKADVSFTGDGSFETPYEIVLN